MSQYLTDGYYHEAAANAPVNERMVFLKRTYGLLFLAIAMLVGIEAFLLKTQAGFELLKTIGGSPVLLIGTVVLLIVSLFASGYIARSGASPAIQFVGLIMGVFLWAAILLIPMYQCTVMPQYANVPLQAGLLTLVVFGGLTSFVFVSKSDFSFLRNILLVGSLVAIGVIICYSFMGLSLGLLFVAAMIALACGYILYHTSNVLHHYPTNAYVAAALALFTSVANLFYYIVWLMMSFSNND